MAQKRSEDINAFLFSIENVEELRTLREIDRNLYSYNALLRNDASSSCTSTRPSSTTSLKR